MVQTIANLKDMGTNFFRWMITKPQKGPFLSLFTADEFVIVLWVDVEWLLGKQSPQPITRLHSRYSWSTATVASLPNQPWNMRVNNDPPCVIKLLIEIYWISSVLCQMLDWGFLLEQMTRQFVSGLWPNGILDGLSSVHGQPLGTGPCETWVEPLGCNGWHTRILRDFKRQQHMQTHGFLMFGKIISALRCVQQWLKITVQSSFGELL